MKRLLLTAFALCTLSLSPCLARAAAAAPPSASSVTAARSADLPAMPEPPDWPPRAMPEPPDWPPRSMPEPPDWPPRG